MLIKLFNAAEAIARFYCGRKGAAVGRMMISLCAAILVVMIFLATWLVPPAYVRIIDWGNGLTRSIEDLSKQVEKIQNDDRTREAVDRVIDINRDSKISQSEKDIDSLAIQLNDHERRIYRLEGVR